MKKKVLHFILRGGALIVLFVLLYSLLIPNIFANTSNNFSVVLNNSNVTNGTTFSATINVTNITNLYGVDITVSYNGTVVDFLSFAESTFLNQSGAAQTMVPSTSVENANNISRMTIVRVANSTGVNGSGNILVMTFRAIAPGTSWMNISEIVASNSTNGSISVVTSNANLTVPSNSSDSNQSNESGGSGGGSTPIVVDASINETQSAETASPNTATVFSGFNTDTRIKEISVQVQSEVQDPAVTVLKYDGIPAPVSIDAPGYTYRYLQIETTNLEGLENATVIFFVEKSWVSDLKATQENIIASKFDEDLRTWNTIPIQFLDEDETYYYYSFDVEDFSYFAIGANVSVISLGNIWVWISAGIILVIIIAVILVIRKRRQNSYGF